MSDLFPDANPNCTVSLLQGLAIPLDELENLSELSGQFSFDSANLGANLGGQKRFNCSFRRQIQEDGKLTPSSIYDEFSFQFSPNGETWREDVKLVGMIFDLVSKLGLPTPTGEPKDDGTLRDLLVGFGASHNQMLQSLNETIKQNEERRLEIEATYAEKEQARISAHQKALDEIEEERAKLQLQSYKAERRRIMQKLTDGNAAKLRKAMAPREAILSRWAVFGAALLVSTFAAIFAYESLSLLNVGDVLGDKVIAAVKEAGIDEKSIRLGISDALGPTNWFLIVRSVISSIVAIGGLVYAASWLRSFYTSEVAASREIDKFNHDLVRASWIIETILEVTHEHEGEIPSEWIQGVTRGLFESHGTNEALDEGAQALRALMGFTASASFGPEGPKVDIGRRDAKKLARSESPK
ncbi:hypothetical protein [Planktotalea arctica]|uniref:hypothetical protein n=1 Tax=Planktotalea arctica TaxID=1481893 RepID=UPI00321A0410